MANFAYILDENNLIRQATIAVSDPDSNFPAHNAGLLPVSKPARCLNRSDPMKWHITFPGTLSVDCIALIAHNIMSGATITVKGGTSFDPSTSLGTMTWKRRCAFLYFAATETTRSHFKVEIDDAANPDGFSQIGYFVIGTATVLSDNFLARWELDEEMINQQALTESGIPIVGKVSEREIVSVSWDGLTEALANELRTPFRASYKNKTPLFVLPEGTTGSKGFLGRFENDLRKSFQKGALVSVKASLAEDASGPIAVEAMPIIGEGVELPSGSVFTRASTAYYKDADFKLVQAASGELRGNIKGGIAGITVSGVAHHFKDGVRGCYLSEPAATNAWTYPKDLSNAAWTKTNITVAANDKTLPDDTTTADNCKISETTANSRHALERDLAGSPTDDTLQSVSFIGAPGTKNRIIVYSTSKAGANLTSQVDLSDGSLGGTVQHNIVVEPYKNGWYRVQVSFDVGVGGTTPAISLRMTETNADWTQVYVGSTSDNIYLWFLQNEADTPFPTSPVETTRAADVLYVPYDFDTQPISLYLKAVNLGLIAASGRDGMLKIGDATVATDPRTEIERDDSQYLRANFDDGTTALTRTGTDAVSLEDIYEALLLIYPDGGLALDYSINGATTVQIVKTGSNSLGAAYSADRMYINGRGGSNNLTPTLYQSIKSCYGAQSLAYMRQL